MVAKFIVLLPLISAMVCGALPKRATQFVQIFASSLLVLTAACACFVFYDVIHNQHVQEYLLFEWLYFGNASINWSVYVDSVTAIMLIVVTIVSAIVHIYSIGYMEYDSNIPKFMSFLSLFTFFMLMLVTSNNILQLFFGWEGVGLCSYLLIGYWYQKDSACYAAMKAFIVNRVADICFAIGIFTLYIIFGTLDFAAIFKQVPWHLNDTINILGNHIRAIDFICFMLFIGCMGKSAQIFFHTWLPDAMEGPTPVSALIHAATMVTAGVFLVVRCSPIFEYSPIVLSFITIVGALSCLFAATIALTQNDIKRIIAYSTCSQLGYMFFACGVSAYNAAMFHLMTHAFFKALLFLGAGSVIHAMSGEQDIRKMGGIYRKVPFTYAMMVIGSLALSGIFPFAGYFSKDAILESAAAAGTPWGDYAYSLGMAAAFCTSFYSFRLLFVTFHGKPTYPKEFSKTIHESPKIMLISLGILSIGAIFSGVIFQYFFGILTFQSDFWQTSIFVMDSNILESKIHSLLLSTKLSPLLASVFGIILAYVFYIYKTTLPKNLKMRFTFLYDISLNKYYFDEIYDLILVQPIKKISYWFAEFVDSKIIDNYGPNGAASISRKFSEYISRMQSGMIYNYALAMLVGIIFIITWYLIAYY